MNESSKIAFGILLGMALLGTACIGLCQESPVVNIMIDADIAPTHSADDVDVAGTSLIKLINEIDPKKRNVTIFVSGGMATVYRLGVASQGTMANHELALYGNNTGEDLTILSNVEQEAILKDANNRLYHCYVCGGKHIDIRGFRPQGFEQNEDTLRILENLSIIYNAGFQQGLIYAPGHEEDAWPYLLDGFKLYAVPITTAKVNGEYAVLYDKYVKEQGLSGSQWQELLQSKFDENVRDGAPTVVIFSNLVSGNGEYLDAYRNFLDYAGSNGARFLTTLQLVEEAAAKDPSSTIPELEDARKGAMDVSPSEKGSVIVCPTCDEAKAEKGASIISYSVSKSKECLNCTDNATINSTELA